MNALELTQRQRELLENILKAVHQYQQAIADAAARLKHELEQIEQSRNKERQRIEEERKEKTKITSEKPPKNESQQKAREEREQRLQREIAARRSTTTPPRGITTIEAVKEEINRTLSTRFSAGAIGIIVKIIMNIIGIIMMIIFLFGLCAFLYGLNGLFNSQWDIAAEGGMALLIGIVGFIILAVLTRPYVKREKAFVVNKIALLHSLYDRWLELVDERASAQRAEAQRRYDQAVAQAKGQMLAAAEQSRLSIAEFSTLTEQVSPSWESEAWRRWEPGSLGPGAVRLGVFTKTQV